jgi:hypothetical protein
MEAGVEVAVGLAAEGGRFALCAAGQDVAALEEGHGHGFMGYPPPVSANKLIHFSILRSEFCGNPLILLELSVDT